MKIGIIGSGNIGATLAGKLVRLGHSVYIANSRGPESLQDIAEKTGATPVSVTEAATNGEIVIITIPQKSILDLPGNLFENALDGVIVIDTCNYYPLFRDGKLPGLDEEFSDSQWVQHQLGIPVIKVFNSISYMSLADAGKPETEPDRIGLPVCGDNESAKSVVMQLVNDLGFDPVDAGTLDNSWRQQPGSPIYCTDFTADQILSELEKMGPVLTQSQRDLLVANRTTQEEYIIKLFSGQKD